MLIAEGFDHHVPKGYISVAMAFSLLVELLNLKAGHRERPVHLPEPCVPEQRSTWREFGAATSLTVKLPPARGARGAGPGRAAEQIPIP